MACCEFCDNDADGMEDYCHRCGDVAVCQDCLDGEWCPDCILKYWQNMVQGIRKELKNTRNN